MKKKIKTCITLLFFTIKFSELTESDSLKQELIDGDDCALGKKVPGMTFPVEFFISID